MKNHKCGWSDGQPVCEECCHRARCLGIRKATQILHRRAATGKQKTAARREGKDSTLGRETLGEHVWSETADEKVEECLSDFWGL